jgi:hypothetical protein
MSPYSPGPVHDEESTVRMVVNPMMVHKKRAELMPNFFGHAFTVGMSVQRAECASSKELTKLVSDFLRAGDERAWLGYVSAPVSSIRACLNDDGERLFAVYDASNRSNPAHAEIGMAYDIPEADVPEMRRKLMKVHGDGTILSRATLNNGEVLAALPTDLQSREVPGRWRTALGM